MRKGNLDVKELFTQVDCTKEVIQRMKGVGPRVVDLFKILAKKTEPKIACGDHCLDPFECPFTEYCGYSPSLESNGSPITGKVTVDKEGLQSFVDQLEYPLYFFDYETVNPAIPYFDNTSPYKQYPFQYSLHIQREKGGELEHIEFLHDEASDPRAALIKRLVKDLGKKGSVIAYYASFEKTVNKKLAELFPQYKKDIDAINSRVVDLIIPFKKGWLNHPAQRGSNSIKDVLPAFCPELSYDDITIHGGSEASGLFRAVLNGSLSGTKKEKLLKDLKEYCGLDTLAMVKLLEVIFTKI